MLFNFTSHLVKQHKTTYYLFVGRPQAWSATTGGGTDAAPPTPLDNVVDPYMYYRDMLAAKILSTTDRQYAIPRHNWTTGNTIYDMYRGDYGATVNSAVVQTQAGGIDMFATGTTNVCCELCKQCLQMYVE